MCYLMAMKFFFNQLVWYESKDLLMGDKGGAFCLIVGVDFEKGVVNNWCLKPLLVNENQKGACFRVSLPVL